MSSAPVRVVRWLGAALALGLGAAASARECDPEGRDAQAIAQARAEVTAQCDCASATSHQEYTRCSGRVLAAQIERRELPEACRRSGQRCARQSTCGRPGAITCCRTLPSGKTRCSIEEDAAHCRAPAGGSACTGAYTSCCDACAGGGCRPAPRCGNGIVEAGEQCDGQPHCLSLCRFELSPFCCDLLGFVCGDAFSGAQEGDCTILGGTVQPGAWCIPAGIPCPIPGVPCVVGSCGILELPPTPVCCQSPGACTSGVVSNSGDLGNFITTCGAANAFIGICTSVGLCVPG